MSQNNTDYTFKGSNQYNNEFNNYPSSYTGQQYGNSDINRLSEMNISDYQGQRDNNVQNVQNNFDSYSHQSSFPKDVYQPMYQHGNDSTNVSSQSLMSINNYPGLPETSTSNSVHGYLPLNTYSDYQESSHSQQSQSIPQTFGIHDGKVGQGIPIRSGINSGQVISQGSSLAPWQGITQMQPIISRQGIQASPYGQEVPQSQGMHQRQELMPGLGMPPGSGMVPGQGTVPLHGMPPGQGTVPLHGMPPGQGTVPLHGMPPGQGTVPLHGMPPGQGTVPLHGMPPGQGMISGHGMPPTQGVPPAHGMPQDQRILQGQSMLQGQNMLQGQGIYSGPGFPTDLGMSPMQGMPPTSYAQSLGANHGSANQSQVPGRAAQVGYGNLPSQNQSLNPDNMPSAVQVIEENKSNNQYNTGARDRIPPLVTTDFVATDQGTSNPKFIRSTLYNVPTTPELLKNLHIPFALSITPFAKLDPLEQSIVCGETGEKGPIRCIRCKAYMSPLMTFIDGGRRFQCNLCRGNTDVTDDYFVHLDQNGNRIDCYQRPELCLGSYELMATKEYCRNDTLPKAPAFIFMIDVSYASVKSGLVSVICKNMKEYILPHLATDLLVPDSPKPLVGFVTYDKVIHFYNMKSNLTKPQMHVISYLGDEVSSDLVPIVDGFLVDPDEAIDQINSLMENIIEMFSSNEEREVILGSVIEAGMEALKAADNRPGKLFVFHSSLPTFEAPGKLKLRDDRTLLGTDKEKSMFSSGSSYYTKLADNCVMSGVSVDLFLTPSAFIDVATLSELPKITGGNLFKYDFFSPSNHEKQFINDLQEAVSAPCAFDAVMRVRTSLGTRAVEYYGNFHMNNTEDVNLACIDSNKSVMVEIKHNDKLQEKEIVYIQVAVLYTSLSGQRRLRIHNISFNVSSNMSEIFKMTDLDTIMNWMSKYSIKVFQSKSIKEVRDEVCQKSAQILASYRRNYAEQSKPAELVLPENLKLLPLYANSLLKCDFMQSGTDLTTDERAFMCFLFNSMDVKNSQVFLYPRLLPLKDLKYDSISLPMAIRDNYGKLSTDGAYLIENGVNMFMFIGQNIEPEWLYEVFNCKKTMEISDRGEVPLFDTHLSQAVNKLIQIVRASRSRYMKLTIVIQGEKMESAFKKMLVEDHGDRGGSSYVEFLCQVHKDIRTILNN